MRCPAIIPETFSLWINGYVHLILSLVGFAANLVSISILCRTEMCNAFNRLLAGLAVSDNLHLSCTIAIASIIITTGKEVTPELHDRGLEDFVVSQQESSQGGAVAEESKALLIAR